MSYKNIADEYIKGKYSFSIISRTGDLTVNLTYSAGFSNQSFLRV